jgi:hypothetical protein
MCVTRAGRCTQGARDALVAALATLADVAGAELAPAIALPAASCVAASAATLAVRADMVPALVRLALLWVEMGCHDPSARQWLVVPSCRLLCRLCAVAAVAMLDVLPALVEVSTRKWEGARL